MNCDLSPPVHITREALFPTSIATEHGLPADFATLEVPNGSTSLYDSILFFVAHYGVDLDQPVQRWSFRSGHRIDGKLSTNGRPSAGVLESNVGKATKSCHIASGYGGVLIPRREGLGRLSSLWSSPLSLSESCPISDSENESDMRTHSEEHSSDTDASSEDENGDRNGQDVDHVCQGDNRTQQDGSGSNPSVVNLHTLRKRIRGSVVQRYHMGLGFAKIQIGKEVVLIHHAAFGLPVAEPFSIQLYRTVVLASRSMASLQEFCGLATGWHADRDEERTEARPGCYALLRYKTDGRGLGDWNTQGFMRSRPAHSIILQDGQLESIVRDIRDFLTKDTKHWYEAHGLPHRRSLLFHGTPGSGKTSTIKMIAGMFGLNACFLSFTMADFCNQVLQDALTTLPGRALLVLEDVDSLFNEDRKCELTSDLTFSGLLNALDGLISVEGIVTIFTTNHVDQLDIAMMRGGRIDRRFEFQAPQHDELSRFFAHFYPSAESALCDKFAEMVLERPDEDSKSIATLQQHFIYSRNMSAEKSVKMLDAFYAEFFPRQGKVVNPLYM